MTHTKEDLLKEVSQIKKTQKSLKYFNPLYTKYSPKLKHYFLTKVNFDDQTADDLVSITFEKALRNINSFKWQGISFSAWLFRIAHNTLVDYYRRQNKQKQRHFLHKNIPSRDIGVVEKSILIDETERVTTVIKTLKKDEREIIRLKFYEGFTNKEIGELVGKSETNVGTIVYRAMQKIRKALTS